MTQKEFFKEIELTREEFRDLLQKFSEFKRLLNKAQRDAVVRSMPTLSQAVRSFGGELTSAQLTEIVNEMHPVKGPDDGDSGSCYVRAGKTNTKQP